MNEFGDHDAAIGRRKGSGGGIRGGLRRMGGGRGGMGKVGGGRKVVGVSG